MDMNRQELAVRIFCGFCGDQNMEDPEEAAREAFRWADIFLRQVQKERPARPASS